MKVFAHGFKRRKAQYVGSAFPSVSRNPYAHSVGVYGLLHYGWFLHWSAHPPLAVSGNGFRWISVTLRGKKGRICRLFLSCCDSCRRKLHRECDVLYLLLIRGNGFFGGLFESDVDRSQGTVRNSKDHLHTINKNILAINFRIRSLTHCSFRFSQSLQF